MTYTIPAYTFTTKQEVERLYGTQGAASQVTEAAFAGMVADVWNEIIYDATTTIESYCTNFYGSSDLANSYWIRSRATWYAAWLASQRRGSTSRFDQRIPMILEELERVRLGILQIPGVPTSSDFTPAMSNVYVDVYSNQNKIKVHPYISTGGQGTRQQISWLDGIASWF